MKDSDLLQKLNLKLMGYSTRIRDLELEVVDLKRKLEAAELKLKLSHQEESKN